MLEALASALTTVLSGAHLFYMLLGVVVGLVVGILPGLGGIAGLSLLLPFIYGLDQISGLALMIGMLAIVPTSDTFTSILMGIPGGNSSQATVLDGFPLAKRGEAARALSASFAASLFGGLFGAIILTVAVLVARPIILAFASPELFMLALLGLTMVGVLADRSFVKGLISCGLGLILGCVGPAPATGEYRLDFGISYLGDNLPLVVIGLAAFAIPEIIDLLRRTGAISHASSLGQGWKQGVIDTWAHKGLVMAASGIGVIIGAIPGIGSSVANWVSYGYAMQTAKDRSQFGKGDIRGVIGPEAANNANDGGGLIPTILFGIPGSGSMAIFLGGLVLLGIDPGRNMVTDRLDLTYAIVWSLALANVIGTALCILVTKPVAKLTEINYVYIAPFMVMVVLFASFQTNRAWGDIVLLFGLGVFAIYMRRFGFPRPPLLIGFVLADGIETNLYQAQQIYDWSWVARPGVLTIGALTVVSIVIGLRFLRAQAGQHTGPAVARSFGSPEVLFTLLLILIAGTTLVDTWGLNLLGKLLPLVVGSLTLVGLLWLLARQTLIPTVTDIYDSEIDDPPEEQPETRAEYYVLWIAGFMAVSAVFGLFIGIALFFLAFLTIEAKASLRLNLILTGSALGFMAMMGKIFVLDMPAGWLQSLVDLPWPLR